MLMTPMTPKVMASPIAASSRTEPSEMPYQTFCAGIPERQRRCSMLAIAVCRRLPDRVRGVSAATVVSSAIASWSPRAAISVDGGDACRPPAASESSDDDGGARLLEHALDARRSVSLASAASSGSMRCGIARLEHGCRRRRCARPDPGASSVSEPSASRMAPRSELLTLDLVDVVRAARRRTVSPVSASISLNAVASLLPMKTLPSALRK